MSRFVVGGRANPGGEGDVGEGEAEEAEGAAVSRETLLSSGGALILPGGRARSISRAGAQNASAAHLLVLACHARAPPSPWSSRSNSPPPPRPPPAASSSGGALILPGCRARSVSRAGAQNASAAHLLVPACRARARHRCGRPATARPRRRARRPPPHPAPRPSRRSGSAARKRCTSRSSAPWGWARTGSGCRPSGWRRRRPAAARPRHSGAAASSRLRGRPAASARMRPLRAVAHEHKRQNEVERARIWGNARPCRLACGPVSCARRTGRARQAKSCPRRPALTSAQNGCQRLRNRCFHGPSWGARQVRGGSHSCRQARFVPREQPRALLREFPGLPPQFRR